MLWTVNLEGGPQRVNHAAVAVDNKIYSFGGYSSSEGYEIVGVIDIHVFNTDTLRWSPIFSRSPGGDAPYRRYGHTVVAYKRKIYLWGGRNDLMASNIVHCFDVDTLKWSLPPTTGRPPHAADGHSACVIGDYMYIFGGFADDTESYGNSVHRLSLISFQWEDVKTYGTPPLCRDFHTASVIGSRMYIFGGRSPSLQGNIDEEQPLSEIYCNKIIYLETESMTWVMPSPKKIKISGRRSHAAFVYEDELYIMGGYNGATQNHLSDIYKFNPKSNKWFKVHVSGKGPCPRRRHCAVVVGRHLYVFGGSSPRVEGEKISSFLTLQSFTKLIDHSDLFVMDFFPSLKRLCQLKIIECGLNASLLPKILVQEIHQMTTNNIITTNDFFPRKDYGVFSFSA